MREETRDGFRIAWVNHTFRESTSIEDAWRAPRVARAVAPIVDAFAPDVAHIHHLTTLSTLIPSILAERGVPVTVTLHDYWLMCHRGQLLDLDGARCDGPGESGCARCIPAVAAQARGAAGEAAVRVLKTIERAAPPLGAALRGVATAGARAFDDGEGGRAASLARTRHVREEVVPHVDLFFAPCAHMRDRFVRFGVAPDRIRVAPYGVAPAPPPEPRPAGTGPLRVGIPREPDDVEGAARGHGGGRVDARRRGHARRLRRVRPVPRR